MAAKRKPPYCPGCGTEDLSNFYLDAQGRRDLVISLYPRAQGNPKLADTVVRLLDAAIGVGDIQERDMSMGGMRASYQQRENQPVAERVTQGYIQESQDYLDEAN